MSSQWTNKFAIMRDLSLAQGCDVPASLETTVGVNEKPPAPNMTEETEEEYYEHWVGDGDTAVAPDLNLIQQMLEMVRDTDLSSDYEDEPDKVLQISKPPLQKETNNNEEPKVIKNNNIQPKHPKKKRENVAVNSILEALAGNTPILNMEKPASEPLKLLKPTDFMATDKEIIDSVEKVNGWLDTQHIEVMNIKSSNRMLNWEPSSMFKRKSGSTVKSSESNSVKSSPPQQVPTTASYRPSALADEYYQKFVERSRLKELVKEDVWTRAEKIMKEIDLKKKSEIEPIVETENADILVISKSPMDSSDSMGEVIGPAEIQLGCHRHALRSAPCAVCAARARHM